MTVLISYGGSAGPPAQLPDVIHALIIVIITGRPAQERFQGIDPTGLLSEFKQS